MKVSLRTRRGEEIATVEIPSKDEPDVIEYRNLTYLRQTRDVYHQVTRLVILEPPT